MKYSRLFLLLLAFYPSLSLSQEQKNPLLPAVNHDVEHTNVTLHSATPFLESSTALLVDINLKKLDLAEVNKWLTDAQGENREPENVTTLQNMLDSLKSAGTSNVYITVAPRSVADGGPIVILPCENPVVVNGLATVAIQNFRRGDALKVHAAEKLVLAGSSAAIDRVLKASGVERPDLILPLRQPRLDHTMVLSLPKESRDVLESLWPEQMPEDSPIPFSPRTLAKDLVRVIVSLRLPPEPQMIVHFETTDIAATERVKTIMENAIALVPEAKASVQFESQANSLSIRTGPIAMHAIAKAILGPSVKPADQKLVVNGMKQVGLAIHNFAATERHLPPRYYTDAAGKPLHSWLVALLPHIEQNAMYNALNLAEVWNSDTNRPLSSTLIPTYCQNKTVKTTFRAPVFPGSLWHGEGPPKRFTDVTDGTANTIAVIDVPSQAAVEWANPEPWVLSVDDPMSDVFGDRESALVLMLDGSVKLLKKSEMTNKKLIAMLTIAAGDSPE